MTSLPSNPDVIVVGAGTAGLSAAQVLMDEGLSVLVLEADDHVGGRCFTDKELFDVPFDLGGSWLHAADKNPLGRLAEKAGTRLHKKHWEVQKLYADGRLLNESELDEFNRYQDIGWDDIRKVASSDADISTAEALSESPYRKHFLDWIPPMLAGDADAASSHDVARYQDTYKDWLVSGGLGEFVKSLHSNVPVLLNSPVSRIEYLGQGVSVTTPRGTYHAKQVIVTVSTGVLASGSIEFAPQLPSYKTEAIQSLPMGLLNKIGIEFDPEWNEAGEGYSAGYHGNDKEFCVILFGFYNTNVACGFVAGSFADQLENEGEGAATEFCMDSLRKLFGNDVIKHVRKTYETAWRGNQFTLGSYSYAKPGCATARESLAETVDGKLFFAGEATIPRACATVHGAYISGKEVAEKVLAERKSG